MYRLTKPFLSLLLFLHLNALPLLGAPPPSRPYTGSGLILIRPASRQAGEPPAPLVFYREPGIGRVAERSPDRLPLLLQVIVPAPGEYPAAVMGRKGNWLCLAYDEGGHLGWIDRERRWGYLPWQELLPGRTVHLLPGLKKVYTILRQEPLPEAGELAPLTPADQVRVKQVQGDWLLVSLPSPGSGWLRWRDDSGRFLIALPEAMSDKD